jgi:fructokinase
MMEKKTPPYRVGIDLGGTKIEGILIESKTGKHLKRLRIPTEQEKGYTNILHNIKKVVDKLTSTLKKDDFSLGIGTPGSLSPQTGLLRNSNTQCLNGKPLQIDLEKLLQKKIKIENDANCFAMAETLFGAAMGKNFVFGVIMGTGCGGGIVIQQKIWHGQNGLGGEWGHSQLKKSGPRCYCGKRGCIETFISGSGVERLYFLKTGQKKSFLEISQLKKKQDKIASQIIANFLDDFARAISNIINTLDPEIIVLGGGLSNFPLLYQKGIPLVSRYVFADTFSTPIVKNRCGDSAGVIGAAYL